MSADDIALEMLEVKEERGGGDGAPSWKLKTDLILGQI